MLGKLQGATHNEFDTGQTCLSFVTRQNHI